MKGFFKCNITKPVSKVFLVIWVKGQGQSPGKKGQNSKWSKTCQVWYLIKGFDKCYLTNPVSKVFKVIWIQGQGQNRSRNISV